MLLNTKDLLGYKIGATDGHIGSVADLLFDDFSWMVRYMVVDTGNWLPGRRVLLAPISVGKIDENEESVAVKLTREQVEKSPPIDAHKPVSRQQETELSRYYGWPAYWSAETRTPPVGAVGMPAEMPPPVHPAGSAAELKNKGAQQNQDPHLRSMREVRGYHIQAQDGEIGHVEDFIIDADMWWTESMVIDTRNWLPGRKVAIPPRQIEKVRWTERKVFVKMLREEIKSSREAGDVLEEGEFTHN